MTAAVPAYCSSAGHGLAYQSVNLSEDTSRPGAGRRSPRVLARGLQSRLAPGSSWGRNWLATSLDAGVQSTSGVLLFGIENTLCV